MKRLILVAALLWPSLASAQLLTPSPQSIGAVFSSACTSTTCATWTVGQAASLTLAVSGTFSGTITFYGSSDGGTTYFAISATKLSDGSSASTTTTTGQYAIANSGLSHVQARFTSYVSGGANITAARGYATAALLTPFFSTGYFSSGIRLASTATIGWSSTTDPFGSVDTTLCRGGTNVIGIGGCTSSFPALKRSGVEVQFRLADDSAFTGWTATSGTLNGNGLDISGAGGSLFIGSRKTVINTAPTIASGGCTSPAVTWNTGTATFLITIGTSCAGVKTFTLTMPAATNRWACHGDNATSDAAQQTNYIVARGTSTTAVVVTSYDRVTGLQEDFTASDSYLMSCLGG